MKGRSRFRRALGVAAASAVLLVVVANAAGSSSSPLHFKTINHKASGWHATNLVPKIGSAWGGVIQTGSGSSDPRWNRINWNRYFAIEAMYAAPTSGYTITIKRVSVQRIAAGKRQFCVLAKIGRPAAGSGVDPRATQVEHAVKLSRTPFKNAGGFGWTFPPDTVLRGMNGQLLATEVEYPTPGVRTYPPAPGLCRP